MRTILYTDIVDKVATLCAQAACDLPDDAVQALAAAARSEQSDLGRELLAQCEENARIARRDRIPICQDTGFAVYFVELGADVRVDGGQLTDAVNEGTRRGYRQSYLRASIVRDPLFDRTNTGDNTPAVIHIDHIAGNGLRILLAPKGGGSENMSAIAMLKPGDGVDGVVGFVTDTVVRAGGNPCPPVMVGVGLGGTFEKAAFLAKKALTRHIGQPHPDARYAELERTILARVNASGVGPQGLGGAVTALAVHVEVFPCHIASMPVAVNMNCHAARHAEVVL